MQLKTLYRANLAVGEKIPWLQAFLEDTQINTDTLEDITICLGRHLLEDLVRN